MAAYTRVNGLGHAVDVAYDTLQIRGYRVEVPAGLTFGIGGTAEALAQEFGTTGAVIEFDVDTMFIIGDAHALTSNIIAKRADKVVGGTGALVNYMAENGNLGTVGSGSAVAGTVAAPVTTALVEVGSMTTYFGLVST
jgi:hypothetical protein